MRLIKVNPSRSFGIRSSALYRIEMRCSFRYGPSSAVHLKNYIS